MDTENPNVVDSALAAAAKVATFDVQGVPHVAVPNGYSYASLEAFLDAPNRAKGVVQLHDTASFIAYVNELKVASSRIYCNADYKQGKATIAAVFNDHLDANGSGWRDLRAVYSPRPSEEWNRWLLMNGKPQTQVAFATFIEDNLRDIASVEGFPSGSDMLAMALSLEVSQDSRFKSAIRLTSGCIDLTFVAKEDAETLEKMRVFERFAIGIPPFFNGGHYQVNARLRYRVREGALSFWYDLIRPDLTLADAVKTELATIAEKTSINPLYGEP